MTAPATVHLIDPLGHRIEGQDPQVAYFELDASWNLRTRVEFRITVKHAVVGGVEVRRMDDLAALTDRIHRLRQGETAVVDLRGHADPAGAASAAIAALAERAREPDEFVLDAFQEDALGCRLGTLKALFGYPVHVVYEVTDE